MLVEGSVVKSASSLHPLPSRVGTGRPALLLVWWHGGVRRGSLVATLSLKQSRIGVAPSPWEAASL
jgi:hypothetical protein